MSLIKVSPYTLKVLLPVAGNYDWVSFNNPKLYGVQGLPEPLPADHRYLVERGPTHLLVMSSGSMRQSQETLAQPDQEVTLWFQCNGSSHLGCTNFKEYCLVGDRLWQRSSVKEACLAPKGSNTGRGLSEKHKGKLVVFLRPCDALNAQEAQIAVRELLAGLMEIAQ